MSRLFLSYDREDGDKARALAGVLEKAGYEVWWDRHIRGGAEYSEEIEQALDRADAVIVLWSKASVKSAWVRDEAAAGRDSGRLVPVLLEQIKPPMGFRQYQTVDLTEWNQRRGYKHIGELTSAIDSISKIQSGAVSDPVGIAQPSSRRDADPFPRWKYLAIAAGAVIAIGGGIWAWDGGPGSKPQTVVISPADAQSKALARKLLIQLGSLQSARSGAVKLVGDDSDIAKHADLIFEAAQGEDRRTANLALLGGEDRSLLWSKDFSESGDSQTSLQLRAATAAAKVLDCAVEGLGEKGGGLDQQNLKIYLNACASITEIGWDKRPVIAAFRKVTDAAPKFGAAWGRLLLAETDALSFLSFQPDTKALLEADLRRDIASARKADPNLAQATLAEMAFMPPAPFAPVMAQINKARVQDPNNAQVLFEHSYRLASVGRMKEAVEEARQAALADPLSSETSANYVKALVYGGQVAKAREELNKAQRLWPQTETLKQAQFVIDLRFGDFSQAIAENSDAGPGDAYYVAMRERPSASTVKAFTDFVVSSIAQSGVSTMAVQALAEVNRPDDFFAFSARKEALADLQNTTYVLFRPWMATIRADPRFMLLAKRLGLTDYWRQSGDWPDFCSDAQLPYNCKAEAAKLG